MTKQILTQAELKKHLHYNPDTGIFTRVSLSFRSPSKIGQVAGNVCSTNGYVRISINNKLYRAHRLAWLYVNGSFPYVQIDHVNLNKADNRWCNLRECTQSENMFNVGLKSNNTSGYKGVVWVSHAKKWRASVHVNGKTEYLGYHENIENAIEIRKKYAQQLHKEFYRE